MDGLYEHAFAGTDTRPCQFTHREWTAVGIAASGHPIKWIACELGVSHSTAWRLLRLGLRKLGLRSRLDLIKQFASGRSGEVRRLGSGYPDLPSGLSKAEREVVLGVLAGMSNAEIARTRRTSVRTIANQLHGIYGKLRVSSRMELAVACSRSGAEALRR
jgi:DNA-binding CsgD family transcriptional regulator